MKFLNRYLWRIKVVILLMFLPLILQAQTNQTVNAGVAVEINLPTGPCVYNWTNNNTSIGLPASGTGNLKFVSVNNTGSPITATITATPVAGNFAFAYVPNSISNTVSVINTNTQTVQATINLFPNTDPRAVAVTPDGTEVFIANTASQSVSYINTATNVAENYTGISFAVPSGVASTPDSKYIYVTDYGASRLVKINRQTRLHTIINVAFPMGVIVSPDGSKVYVVSNAASSVSVVSTSTDEVLAEIPTNATKPFYIAVTPDGNRLYVTHRGSQIVSVLNTVTSTFEKFIVVDREPNGIVASRDGRIYVANTSAGTISVISTTTNEVIKTVPLSNPTGLSINADGSLLYATDVLGGKVSVINTTDYSIVTSIPVGEGPFSVGSFLASGISCNSASVTFTITVNPFTGPTINTTGTPSSVSTTYGAASSPTSFMVSGFSMTASILVTPPTEFEVSLDGTNFSATVTIPGAGIIASKQVFIRLKATAAVGTYTGDIVLSSKGASDVKVSMLASTVNPAPVIISVIADVTYGEVLNNMTLTPSNFDFSKINSNLKNGETIVGLDIAVSGGNTGREPVGRYDNVIRASNIKGANGFLLSNYAITYQDGRIIIAPAPLVVTANNANKPLGNTLTGASGSTEFTVTGLQNAETINSVTITYGNGAAANAPTGTYAGSVVPSAIVGGNGYLTSNYTITYTPGDIVVTRLGVLAGIPNTFTPNGDGINDTWDISSLNPNLKITVEVVNRYGTRVYLSNGYSSSWDGYSNGVPVPFGVYYYIITGVKEKPLTGYITVVR